MWGKLLKIVWPKMALDVKCPALCLRLRLLFMKRADKEIHILDLIIICLHLTLNSVLQYSGTIMGPLTALLLPAPSVRYTLPQQRMNSLLHLRIFKWPERGQESMGFWSGHSVTLIDYGAIIIEPTCAYCTVGSYASLSVCPSVRHWIIIHISGSNRVRNLKLYHNILRL